MNPTFIKPRYDEGGFAGIPNRITQAFASGAYDAVVLFLVLGAAVVRFGEPLKRLDLERTQELIRNQVVSQQTLDKARTAHDVAAAQAAQTEEQYRLVVAGPRRERIAAARAQAAQAEAALAAADASLANMVIRAPFAGVVTVRHREPGEIVGAGAAVLSLMDRDDRWVRIYVSEARIGAVHTGQAATITTDTFRGKTYPGEVVHISSEAEFTPKNVQTEEERVKLVYAVKVRVGGDPDFELKPGMPADVRLATGP